MVESSLKKSLKARAHHLKPVILLGAKGLTEAVVAETDNALLSHELIKVKFNNSEKEERLLMINELCRQLSADLIDVIGKTAIIYRKSEEKHK